MHKTKSTHCPCCKNILDCAVSPMAKDEKAKPKSGDFTICMNCGELFRFTQTMDIRKLIPAEYEIIAKNPKMAAMLAKIRVAVTVANIMFPKRPEHGRN